jgi:predicted DNA-binding protein (UPF0251 family)
MPWASNPVRIRGVDYPSQKAAALALGTSKNTITNALDEGWIDEVGLRRRGQRPKPCTFRGNHYPSRKAAAEACGVSVQTVSREVTRTTRHP